MTIDNVLKDEWFAVLKSEDIKDDPVQIMIMGERVVIFRTRKGIHAFKDLCIHRGSALSLGKVVDDTLRCPYHGWQYNSEGQCICIPAQPGVAIPKKAVAQLYLCKEQYGLVWVSLGNPSRDVPKFEQFVSQDYRSYYAGPYKIKASAPRIIENFLDYSHLMWIHEGVLGDSSFAEIKDHKIHRVEGTLVSDEVVIHEYADIDNSKKLVPNIYIKKALRPLVGYLNKKINSGDRELSSMIIVTPVDPETTLAYMIVAQNFDMGLDDAVMLETSDLIMQQDIEILENQRPEELPLDLQEELNLKSDQMSIAYRRWLRELGVSWGTV